MSLAQFGIDDGPHNMDGLRPFAAMELNVSRCS
jgi:hypothetical protein